MSSPTESRRAFTIVKHLAAPPETVFRAWTDPDRLTWFAGVEPSIEHPGVVDLRVGGVWSVSGRSRGQ